MTPRLKTDSKRPILSPHKNTSLCAAFFSTLTRPIRVQSIVKRPLYPCAMDIPAPPTLSANRTASMCRPRAHGDATHDAPSVAPPCRVPLYSSATDMHWGLGPRRTPLFGKFKVSLEPCTMRFCVPPSAGSFCRGMEGAGAIGKRTVRCFICLTDLLLRRPFVNVATVAEEMDHSCCY